MANEAPSDPDPFSTFLRADETIAWSGQPDPAVLFTPADRFIVPFSILWGGFALVWNILVWAGGAPWFFRLWGLPFLVIGGYVTVGRFVVRSQRKRKTFYAITNERALIVNFRQQLRFVELRRVMRDVVENRRHASVSVGFRDPASPAPGRFTSFFDPDLDSTYFSQTTIARRGPTFAFLDVTDGVALMLALKNAPEAN